MPHDQSECQIYDARLGGGSNLVPESRQPRFLCDDSSSSRSVGNDCTDPRPGICGLPGGTVVQDFDSYLCAELGGTFTPAVPAVSGASMVGLALLILAAGSVLLSKQHPKATQT